MSSIEIRNFEADDTTQFTIKDVRFNHNTLKTPFKTLDFNDLGSLRDIRSLERRWLDKNPVIEKSQNVKKIRSRRKLTGRMLHFFQTIMILTREFPFFPTN